MTPLQELSKRILCHLYDSKWEDVLKDKRFLHKHKESLEVFPEIEISLAMVLKVLHPFLEKSDMPNEIFLSTECISVYNHGIGYGIDFEWHLVEDSYERYLHHQSEETIQTLLSVIPEYE